MEMNTPPEQILKVLKNKVRQRYYARCRGLGWASQECLDWFEEVSGEGLAAAYRDKDEWDAERGSFLFWAYMKTCALARRELQRSESRISAEGILVLESPDIEYRDTLAEYLMKDELKGILDVLTPDQKLAFAYYYVGNFEVSDISRAMGCKPKTVYTLLDRGRKRAREVYRRLRAGVSAEKSTVVSLTYPRPRKKDSAKTDEDEEPPPTFPEYRQGFDSNRPLWSG